MGLFGGITSNGNESSFGGNTMTGSIGAHQGIGENNGGEGEGSGQGPNGADGPGMGGDGGEGGGYYKGGVVTKNRLHGPDPKGPDQGSAPLKAGEIVINAKAAKKYKALLLSINNGTYKG